MSYIFTNLFAFVLISTPFAILSYMQGRSQEVEMGGVKLLGEGLGAA